MTTRNRRVMGILSSFFFAGITVSVRSSESRPIEAYSGYVTVIRCKGRTILSSVGNPDLINLDIFPKELGCGAILQPKMESGRTDIFIKTSVRDYHRIIEVKKASHPLTPQTLEHALDDENSQGGSS